MSKTKVEKAIAPKVIANGSGADVGEWEKEAGARVSAYVKDHCGFEATTTGG